MPDIHGDGQRLTIEQRERYAIRTTLTRLTLAAEILHTLQRPVAEGLCREAMRELRTETDLWDKEKR